MPPQYTSSGTEVGSTMLTPHSRKASSHPKTCYYAALPKRKYLEDGTVVKDLQVFMDYLEEPSKIFSLKLKEKGKRVS